jgi:hypothetical protein
MQIVHARNAPRHGASAHREGGVSFVSLLHGEENTPGNFHLMLVEAQDYVAPRHRHNFDQVRILLDGAFGFDRDQVQRKGMWGYFPEGTYYTQHGKGRSTTLLLQSGGASNAGYMSDRQLRTAVGELQARGTFANGIFTWHNAAGKKHNQDGYEAAWEHVRKRPIAYVKPSLPAPALWEPNQFGWQNMPEEGLFMRNFSALTGNAVRLAQVKIAAGAVCPLSAAACETLVYVQQGQATLSGELSGETLVQHSAIRLLRGEAVTLQATHETVLIAFGLAALS